ncbi:PREDICTED: cyclin-A2-4 [Prunus dulcis]|uniref:B-like cyclin n=1 Tax=Prunus dulcis TaxID=3755 RepID=A0A5E4GE53_PRUDU|nr:cyclin-A2-4-like isoform X1 [Prunus dulcis]XP_034210047.1 cyclin-A2-4 isoform X1 [Prunus dulcis]VVA38127.1 PREDICTED: cyclin-A2-4 [Prunus dulcis]VVA38652.1 PREDICTED: cyclin-A2-4 [Prunus dulcis]
MSANMKRENMVTSNVRELPGRITRARAAALHPSGQMPPIKPPTQQSQKQAVRTNPKRAATDENSTKAAGNACMQRKRRAVLQDVTNACCKPSYGSCFNATKIQVKNSKPAKKGQAKLTKMVPSVALDLKTEAVQGIVKPELTSDLQSINLEDGNMLMWSTKDVKDVHRSENQSSGSRVASKVQSPSNKAHDGSLSADMVTSSNQHIVNIDADYKDPQLCSLYAPDIYNHLCVAELDRRPNATFMETIQQDITKSMRGILIDWLVEVSEEYKLVADTLYLTVYLIDWFLCHNYTERTRLQLLGITCMLIASKYEEICAPRVEELCFMTDNTYSKEEVLKMESQVLKYFGFQLFAPTTKTFLRRFLRAAQASYKTPSLELEYLANYLAELTLVDYSFLNFLPSVVAASAVFLSKWTLDQSSHPWNPILEHYTRYTPLDLKITVLALQDLQLNTNGCPLSAVRMKYRHQKFKSVAGLSSPKLLETLF